MSKDIIIGTRASRLAFKQACIARDILKKRFAKYRFVVKKVFTTADKDKNRPLRKFSSTGVFVKELENLLINKKIDIAVHSAKDLETVMPKGLTLAAVLKREIPFDVLISKKNIKLNQLKPGAVIGTGSLRRAAQLKNTRSDLTLKEIRGNVETRIKKLNRQNYDAIVLAYAGLKRLGMLRYATEVLDILPCAGQGIIALQARKDNTPIMKILKAINYKVSFNELMAEKAFLNALHAGCNVPVGVLAKTKGRYIAIKASVLSRDGQIALCGSLTAIKSYPKKIGLSLARSMVKKGAKELLKK